MAYSAHKTMKYQSEIDKFFHEFDEKRTNFPEARLLELKKHKAIFKKRDEPTESDKSPVWQDF